MAYNKRLNYTRLCECRNTSCSNEISIRFIGDPTHPEYNQPIKKHLKVKFCSVSCQNQWQKTISWEERYGEDKSKLMRDSLSDRSTHNNPSTDPEIAKKISKGVALYCEKNPEVRRGENNGFFGRKHNDDTIGHWKNSKKGKRAYTNEQYEKLLERTPKGADHPNWNNGSSNGEYGPEFTRELKREVKESYDHVCQLCHTETMELDVHHIDYDKLNNHSSNLIPLCKVCHGKTNYKRDEWRKLFEDMKSVITN
jgi:hypothetical protein